MGVCGFDDELCESIRMLSVVLGEQCHCCVPVLQCVCGVMRRNVMLCYASNSYHDNNNNNYDNNNVVIMIRKTIIFIIMKRTLIITTTTTTIIKQHYHTLFEIVR